MSWFNVFLYLLFFLCVHKYIFIWSEIKSIISFKNEKGHLYVHFSVCDQASVTNRREEVMNCSDVSYHVCVCVCV